MTSYEIRQWRSIQNAIIRLKDERYQTPRIAESREELEAAEKTVSDLAGTQGQNKTGDGPWIEEMREDLRVKHIDPMSGAGIRYLKGMPGIKDLLRLPPTHVADRKLIEAAKRIIDNVRPYADTFIAHRWRPDFIERADAAVKKFEQYIGTPSPRANKRSRATASIPDAIREGRDIVRSITRLVNDDLADDPDGRKLWARAQRVPGPMGRPKYPRFNQVENFPRPPKKKE